MGLRPKPRAGRPPAYGVSAAGGWFWLVVAGRPQYWISGFGWLALALRPKCRRIVNIQVGRIKASQWATPEHHNQKERCAAAQHCLQLHKYFKTSTNEICNRRTKLIGFHKFRFRPRG